MIMRNVPAQRSKLTIGSCRGSFLLLIDSQKKRKLVFWDRFPKLARDVFEFLVDATLTGGRKLQLRRSSQYTMFA